MNPRPLCLLLVVSLLALGGCVAKSDYLKKTAEADVLTRNLEAMTAENAGLKDQVSNLLSEKEKLTADLEKLISDRGRLTEEKTMLTVQLGTLSARLKAKSDEMARTVQEMKNKATELEGDKQMLAESIALLKKTKEEEVRTVSKTYEELLTEMKGEIEQGQIAITELKGKLIMDVVDKILFDSGKAEVKPEGLQVLKRVVEILKTVEDKTIRVEGHTDNVPIAGNLIKRYPSNWELSAARAINVMRFLEKEGLDPAVLSAAAFGQYQPVADNDTPEGRARNRRIAIILLPKEGAPDAALPESKPPKTQK